MAQLQFPTLMDLSDCMRAIVREAFPEATVVRDCFHVIKRAGEGIEELRLRFKREAVKDVNRQKAEIASPTTCVLSSATRTLTRRLPM